MASQYSFETPLTAEDILEKDKKDHEEENLWLLENYQHPKCQLIQEKDLFYLKKTRDQKIIKVRLPNLSLLDRYFEICTKN